MPGRWRAAGGYCLVNTYVQARFVLKKKNTDFAQLLTQIVEHKQLTTKLSRRLSCVLSSVLASDQGFSLLSLVRRSDNYTVCCKRIPTQGGVSMTHRSDQLKPRNEPAAGCGHHSPHLVVPDKEVKLDYQEPPRQGGCGRNAN